MWRHDVPGQTRDPGSALVSCLGSCQIIDLPPAPGRQMELDLPDGDTAAAAADDGDRSGTLAMF